MYIYFSRGRKGLNRGFYLLLNGVIIRNKVPYSLVDETFAFINRKFNGNGYFSAPIINQMALSGATVTVRLQSRKGEARLIDA